MATKPLTTEAIALTEKKIHMTLDDIIKMSQNPTSKVKRQRVPNKSQKSRNPAQEKSSNVRRFMDSRSSIRQGYLAQKRSNFQGNQFPFTTEVARKAAVAPIRNGAFNNRNKGQNWNKSRVGMPAVRKPGNVGFVVKKQQQVVGKQRPQTLDSLFANMKEQRMRRLSSRNSSWRYGMGWKQMPRRGRVGRGGFGN